VGAISGRQTGVSIPVIFPNRPSLSLFGGFGPAAEIAAARELAGRFADMVKQRLANDLDGWLNGAENSELRSFAAGLRQDRAAVRAALTTPWSNGQAEGQIAKLKRSNARCTVVPNSICSVPASFNPHEPTDSCTRIAEEPMFRAYLQLKHCEARVSGR